MAYVPADSSPAGPPHTLEMPSQQRLSHGQNHMLPGRALRPWAQTGCLHYQPFFLAQAWEAWLPACSHLALSTYLQALVPEGNHSFWQRPLVLP